MKNYQYEELYRSFLFGIKLTELMNTQWFGQPSGLGIGQEIIEKTFNFAFSWVCRGIITIEKANEIRNAYYDNPQVSTCVGQDGEGCPIFEYTFTVEEFELAKAKFKQIYECKIPDIAR